MIGGKGVGQLYVGRVQGFRTTERGETVNYSVYLDIVLFSLMMEPVLCADTPVSAYSYSRFQNL